MHIRTLSDFVDLGDKGCILMSWKDDAVLCFEAGMHLRDVKGNAHPVARITEEEGVYMIHLPSADADYIGRLFRDIRIDGPTFLVEGAPSCP